MTNKYRPHVLILPEDDANRQIANGFITLSTRLDDRAIQILPPAGGWQKVVDAFKNNHVEDMRNYNKRRIILIIDFDNHLERLDFIRSQIPQELTDRVFILGVLSEPEKLKASMHYKGLEDIGMSLAQDCAENTQRTWGHKMLMHNKPELDRLISSVRPFLFPKN